MAAHAERRAPDYTTKSTMNSRIKLRSPSASFELVEVADTMTQVLTLSRGTQTTCTTTSKSLRMPLRRMARGRDAGYRAPPAQIRVCGTTAPGSCLGSNAQTQSACRTQSCACGRVSRPCVRPLWYSTRFPLASPLLSTPSAHFGTPEPLCEGFVDTMGLSDSLHPSITVVPRRFTVRTWHHCQARCRASRVPHTVFPCMPEVSDPARSAHPLP